jgi:hypothetical protein
MKATTCRVKVCNEPVLARELCKGHYSRWRAKGEDGLEAPLRFMSPPGTSKSTCSATDCVNIVGRGGRGMCTGHYRRWRTSGDAQADKPLVRVRQQCKVTDCTELSSCRGYCNAHSLRIRRNGTAGEGKPIGVKYKRMPGTECRAPDCDRRRARKGLCLSHFRRWVEGGEEGLGKPIRVARYTTGCAVADCPAPVLAKDLCRAHYWRKLRDGDVRADEPIRKPPAIGEPCTVEGCPKTIVRVDKCSAHYQAAMLDAVKSDPDRYEAYKEYQRSRKKAEWLRDPDAKRAKARAWRKANPSVYRAANLRRRRLLANAVCIPYSKEQLEAKMAYWGNACWVCGGPFEAIDHVKPLSRGGAEILANLRPICTSDNSSKNANWPWSPPGR